MNDPKLNERESIELIARMIQKTRTRIETSDSDTFLSWGILTTTVAVATCIALIVTRNPASNILWGLIAVGGLFIRMKQKRTPQKGYQSYSDKISASIWKITRATGILWVIACVIYQWATGSSPWMLMFIYAFVVVGLSSAFQGLVIQIKSLVFGGLFSTITGGIVACFALCGEPLSIRWVLPLYIVCMFLMTIVPGLKMRKLARSQS